MKPEIEVKITGLTPDKIDALTTHLSRLRRHRAHSACLYVRHTFEVPGKLPSETRVRLRQEHDGLYLTVKEVRDPQSASGTWESEVKLADKFSMDDAKVMLCAMGLIPAAYQETRRTKYSVLHQKYWVTVTLDEWPGLLPFLEVEGPTEEAVYAVVEKLGFTREQTTIGAASVVYEKELGIPPAALWTMNLTFANPPTKWIGLGAWE